MTTEPGSHRNLNRVAPMTHDMSLTEYAILLEQQTKQTALMLDLLAGMSQKQDMIVLGVTGEQATKYAQEIIARLRGMQLQLMLYSEQLAQLMRIQETEQ